mgnify:FL=1
MLEKHIERKLTDAIKSRDGMALKQTGMAGIPDRLVLLPNGKCAFVELKAPGEKPRKLQKIRMKQLRKLGLKTYVIDGVEQIGGVLDEIQSS